jgi:hypothetical protein
VFFEYYGRDILLAIKSGSQRRVDILIERTSNMRLQIVALVFAVGFAIEAKAATAVTVPDNPLILTQSMQKVPPSPADPAHLTAKARMDQRFPQPVRVGDLIGMPVLDGDARTLGYIREVVRTPQDDVALIVSYSKWFGWLGWDSRPVAVPIEAVGIFGRNIASLDMPRSAYADGSTWSGDGKPLKNDDLVRVALARH